MNGLAKLAVYWVHVRVGIVDVGAELVINRGRIAWVENRYRGVEIYGVELDLDLGR